MWDLGLGSQAAAFLLALGSLERQQIDARWLGLAKAGLQLVGGGGSKGEWWKVWLSYWGYNMTWTILPFCAPLP